jgi:hypothetical protein
MDNPRIFKLCLAAELVFLAKLRLLRVLFIRISDMTVQTTLGSLPCIDVSCGLRMHEEEGKVETKQGTSQRR